MKFRQNLYIDQALSDALDDLARKPGTNKSQIVSDALAAYLARRGTKEIDDLLKGRLDRISREIGHARRDIEVLLESLSLFVRYQLTVTAPLPEADTAARAVGRERFRFLSHADRDRLIGCYSPHVQPIATMFAFQGPRTQEALQLVWGAGGVDMERGAIFFARTKTGTPRTVEIHPRVAAALRPIWEERGKPEAGHVFLNRRGVPYTDTRDLKVQGGNPLQTAHENACRRAGIADFTVHDWRHHWASHCVMAGVDLITVMRLGGWKSLRMVQRYAAVDTNHMKAAVLRLT